MFALTATKRESVSRHEPTSASRPEADFVGLPHLRIYSSGVVACRSRKKTFTRRLVLLDHFIQGAVALPLLKKACA